jgi:hypothetical protein
MREPAYFELAPADVRRWKLAREAMDKHGLEKPTDDMCFLTAGPVLEMEGGWEYLFRPEGATVTPEQYSAF